MTTQLVAGVDCSTQSTKVLVIDVSDGRVVAVGRAPHELTGGPGAYETEPDVWWRALRASVADTGLADQIEAVSVAAQQHGLVVLDRAGRPLHPAVLWNDTRSAPDAQNLVEALGGPGAWAELVGSVPVAALTVAKWAWLRRTHEELCHQVEHVFLPHDYLTWRLTGRAVTDRGDASGTGWWSPRHGDYRTEVLGLPSVDLDVARLPTVLGPREQAGPVSDDAAKALGLRAGIPVAVGTGDNMAAALGLGVPPGIPVMSLGTSGTAYAVSDQPAADDTGMVSGFADADGQFLPLACTLNCTLAVDRVAAWLGRDREDVDSGGQVVFLPYLDGERTPDLPAATGTATGLRHDTTPGQILRASYEGAAATLLEVIELLDDHSSGIDPAAPLVLTGGGAQGAVWQEVVARLSGRALEIPDGHEHVAVGAAIQAAQLLTSEEPVSIAARWETRKGRSLEARPRDEETLHRIRSVRSRADALLQSGDGPPGQEQT